MKKLIALVLILALPTLAFGATNYAVQVGGASSTTYAAGSAPASLAMDIVLSLGPEAAGTFGFGGALTGPMGNITARTYVGNAANAIWLPNGNPIGPIASKLDFGEVETAAGADLSGTSTVVTLTVTGLPNVVGVYTYVVGDSVDFPPSGGGGTDMNTGWWSNTGVPVATDSVTPFVITVTPEPATMLLLAGVLPFLRRRSA